MVYRCKCCDGAEIRRILNVREMMFGTREVFEYAECEQCRSVQIVSVPNNLSQYYGDGYYSFKTKGNSFASRIKAMISTLRDKAYFGSIIFKPLSYIRPSSLMNSLSRAGLKKELRILDVGCGAGLLVDRLARCGFSNLGGIDPFVEKSFITKAGVSIQKQTIAEFGTQQDLIMFNHSLEHVIDPFSDLCQCGKLLKDGGMCIVRIPSVSSEAFDRYEADWVQLDAPRHILIPSRDGMRELAKRAGFSVVKSLDDAWSFGFWGSELYRKDISLNGNAPSDHFSNAELAGWKKTATQMNRESRGDSVVFVLKKTHAAV